MRNFDEDTSAITRIARLQNQLLDHTGHVARGRSRDDTRIDLDEIQRLREKVGWKPLDMTGRWSRRQPSAARMGGDPVARGIVKKLYGEDA